MKYTTIVTVSDLENLMKHLLNVLDLSSHPAKRGRSMFVKGEQDCEGD